MEWQQLLGFYQVAKLGSFTKAAEATFRTQSALSQQVKALEEELGAQLMERLGQTPLASSPRREKSSSPLPRGFWPAMGPAFRKSCDGLKGRPQGPFAWRRPSPPSITCCLRPSCPICRQFPQVELTLLDRPQAARLRPGEKRRHRFRPGPGVPGSPRTWRPGAGSRWTRSSWPRWTIP